MSTEGKINATAKNLEGKAEEVLGNLTGDQRNADGRKGKTECKLPPCIRLKRLKMR
ncbi:MAG UNVERIFIED_CONTAM: CsbD family protein [Microcystis novacekii LVE1205-3]|jgi:uncharacterized protein YjbJ (UPF0337 family)